MTEVEEVFDDQDLAKCSETEAHIYRLLHNIPYGEATLEQTAQILGCTRERVRQLEHRALRKLGMKKPNKKSKINMDDKYARGLSFLGKRNRKILQGVNMNDIIIQPYV